MSNSRTVVVSGPLSTYALAIDPATEVPPPGLFSVPRHRPAAHVYSPAEITDPARRRRNAEASVAGGDLHHDPRPACRHRHALGRGENAVAWHDVALDDGALIIRHAKFDRMRLVPLHATTTAALQRYALTRDLLCPEPNTDRFGSACGRQASEH